MEKRRMPVEENWFEKKTNDLLYGFMQASATFNKEEIEEMKKLYYPKAQFIQDLKMIKKLLECKDKRTIMSKINVLIDRGYLAEDDDNYYFPYERENFYLLMDKDLLFYICTTMSEFSVKTYVYLADKARMKDDYHFTIKEIKTAFGYSDNTRGAIENIIANCLALLSSANLIKYEIEYVELPSSQGEYKVPNMVLKNVSTKMPEVTKENIQKIKEVSAASEKFVF